MSEWDERLRRTLEPDAESVERTLAGAAELAERRARSLPWTVLATAAVALTLAVAVWRFAGWPSDKSAVEIGAYSMVNIGQVVRVTKPTGDTWLVRGSSAEESDGSIVIMTGGER